MNDLFTVIGFTLKNKIKSKAFIITSIVFAIIISIVIHIPLIIQAFDSEGPDRVGMFADEQGIAEELKQHFDNLEDQEIVIELIPKQELNIDLLNFAKEQIKTNDLKGFLNASDEMIAGFPKYEYLSEGTMDFGTRSVLESALQVLKTERIIAEIGISDEQYAALTVPVSVENVQLSTSVDGDGRSEMETMVAYFMVYVLMILLFMGVVMYGNMIAAEVTSEKSSRVMELLISSVAPLKQMFGKIIGICLVGILQLLFFFLVGLANLLLPHNIEVFSGLNFSLADVPISLVIYFAVFYLLGFFLYGTLFAALGSIVSRSEDLGQAIMPVTFLTLAGFYIGIFGLNAPNAALIVGASFFPFFTPLIMFLRIGMADPALWEIALSLVILAGSILGMGWIASKIYRAGVLMYGKRPSWKELRKAMKSNES